MNALPLDDLRLEECECLKASEWAKLLGITPRAVQLKKLPTAPTIRNNQMAAAIRFTSLPADWQSRLESRRAELYCRSFADMLDTLGAQRTQWAPAKKWEEYPEASKLRGEQRIKVLGVYEEIRNQGLSDKEATKRAIRMWEDLTGEKVSGRSIRRWVKRVEQCGGFGVAGREAYLDEKSCKHDAARIEVRLRHELNLDEEAFGQFIAEVKARATEPGAEHMSAVHFSLRRDWMMGRLIPGIGVRKDGKDFPVTKKQLRNFMPTTPTRRLASHGIARYERECSPWIHQSVSSVRPLELVVLDDTRIDLVCYEDANPSRLIELKAYILMDVGTRKILGFTVKAGAIGQEDVSALLARFLRGCGLPKDYPLGILFERGTIACADAAESLLTSIWPGRVDIHRTSMDGGRSGAAAFWEANSGHWMGKAWIESFMRTLAISLESLPGQRGGNFKRQPAMLGLQGRDHASGGLRYVKGQGQGHSTQMHEAALTAWADLSIQWLETGNLKDPRPRLRSNPLRPKSWVIEQIAETVALYNAETDHRRGGFERLEFLDATGAKKWRMESSNERWDALSERWPAQRINPADAVSLLKWRGKTVTVDARNGVTFDLAPFKGLRFFKPGSLACHLASALATQEKKMVALYDAEAFRTWRADCGWPLEIHLLTDVAPDWKPGDPGRYLETLPMYGDADRCNEASMAALAADKASRLRRAKLELTQAAGARVARQLIDLEHDEAELAGVVVPMDLTREQLPESPFAAEVRGTSRSAQRAAAEQARPARPASADLEF